MKKTVVILYDRYSYSTLALIFFNRFWWVVCK